jgi:hypothetical protein
LRTRRQCQRRIVFGLTRRWQRSARGSRRIRAANTHSGGGRVRGQGSGSGDQPAQSGAGQRRLVPAGNPESPAHRPARCSICLRAALGGSRSAFDRLAGLKRPGDGWLSRRSPARHMPADTAATGRGTTGWRARRASTSPSSRCRRRPSGHEVCRPFGPVPRPASRLPALHHRPARRTGRRRVVIA